MNGRMAASSHAAARFCFAPSRCTAAPRVSGTGKRLRPAMQQLDFASLHLAVRLRRISKYYEACYGKRAPRNTPRNISLHGLVFTKSLYSISIHVLETVLE